VEGCDLVGDIVEDDDFAEILPPGIGQGQKTAVIPDPVAAGNGNGSVDVLRVGKADQLVQLGGNGGKGPAVDHRFREAVPLGSLCGHLPAPLPGRPVEVFLVDDEQQLDTDDLPDLRRDALDRLPQLQVAGDLAVDPPGKDQPQGEGAERAQLQPVSGSAGAPGLLQGVAEKRVPVQTGLVHTQITGAVRLDEIEVADPVAHLQIGEEGQGGGEQPLPVPGQPVVLQPLVSGKEREMTTEHLDLLPDQVVQEALGSTQPVLQFLLDAMGLQPVEAEDGGRHAQKRNDAESEEDAPPDVFAPMSHGRKFGKRGLEPYGTVRGPYRKTTCGQAVGRRAAL
jgi:hypothetical protein